MAQATATPIMLTLRSLPKLHLLPAPNQMTKKKNNDADFATPPVVGPEAMWIGSNATLATTGSMERASGATDSPQATTARMIHMSVQLARRKDARALPKVTTIPITMRKSHC
jgi:hypothetical protein